MPTLDTSELSVAEVAAVRRLLESPNYELIPLKNVLEQAEHLPRGATVSVTASPAKGMAATIDLSLDLHARGFDVIPHLSARLTRDRAELGGILERMQSGGLRKAFVVGGDATDPGEFFDGLSLLKAMDEMGHELDEVGVPGYPEGHHIVDRATIERALADKTGFASYVTTQMCFRPETIAEWVGNLREKESPLAVQIGLPGVAELRKLITLSMRIGVGASARFLEHNRGVAGRLARPGGYTPDDLVLGLAALLADPAASVSGFHIYTFNQVETTEAWRREMLATL